MVISGCCFVSCVKLKNIIIEATNWDTACITKDADIFSDISKDATFSLPKSKYKVYKKAILKSAPDTVKFKKGK